MQYDFSTHIASIAILCTLWLGECIAHPLYPMLILSVLAFAAYTTDRIGYFSCESLDGTTRPTSPPHSPCAFI